MCQRIQIEAKPGFIFVSVMRSDGVSQAEPPVWTTICPADVLMSKTLQGLKQAAAAAERDPRSPFKRETLKTEITFQFPLNAILSS